MLKVKVAERNIQASLGGGLPRPGHDVLARVEKIWNTEKLRCSSSLFNGGLFSVSEISSGNIIGVLTEYKWFLAQRRDPSLFQHLQVRPLAVTGLALCKDGVVIGRRAAHVEQDANAWELVPSGSIDSLAVDVDGDVDFKAALETELVEETGISVSAVQTYLEPFVVVEDSESHVTDVGILMRISLTKNEVMAAFEKMENREYEVLDVWPLDLLLKARSSHLTPVSRAIMTNIEPVLRDFQL